MSKPLIDYYITYGGGNCPVQIEGKIRDHTFYFRARGSSWTVEVFKPENITETKWAYSEPYGGQFEAGWISLLQAHVFLEKALIFWENKE